MKKTHFDRYLAEQMEDPAFALRFKQAGEAWDVTLQLAAPREQAGLSQAELARSLIEIIERERRNNRRDDVDFVNPEPARPFSKGELENLYARDCFLR